MPDKAKRTVLKKISKKKIPSNAIRQSKKIDKTEKKVKVKKELKTVFDPTKIIPYEPKKGEEYMGESMMGHFRKILITWKKSLRESMDRTVNYMKETASNFPDLSDRATQEEQFSFELRERDRERQLLQKIEESIAMLDEGSYGYCEECGEEIGLRRLEVRPTATLCIDCKTLDEIRERQIGS